ncbi:hypothetical protein V8C34DRAFT_291454 [Trichoderma compactum]
MSGAMLPAKRCSTPSCSMLLLAVSWLQRSRDAKPNQQPPGMSRFNTGQSFTTVTPGRRATRLLLADSYSIVMRVLSHVISSHDSDALSPLQCAHAMYPRRDIEATLISATGTVTREFWQSGFSVYQARFR